MSLNVARTIEEIRKELVSEAMRASQFAQVCADDGDERSAGAWGIVRFELLEAEKRIAARLFDRSKRVPPHAKKNPPKEGFAERMAKAKAAKRATSKNRVLLGRRKPSAKSRKPK
jgi:hypothetical protein